VQHFQLRHHQRKNEFLETRQDVSSSYDGQQEHKACEDLREQKYQRKYVQRPSGFGPVRIHFSNQHAPQSNEKAHQEKNILR